jgi:hypothetical protein
MTASMCRSGWRQKRSGLVHWNAQKQQVEILSGQSTIILSLGSKSAFVNGSKKNFDATLLVMSLGTVHAELRAVGDLLGTRVRWDSSTQAVYVGSF